MYVKKYAKINGTILAACFFFWQVCLVDDSQPVPAEINPRPKPVLVLGEEDEARLC